MNGAQDELRIKTTHLAALLLAIFGGNAALTYTRTEPEMVRPDPFSGADGRALRADLERQIDQLTRRVDAIRADVNLCLLKQHAAD